MAMTSVFHPFAANHKEVTIWGRSTSFNVQKVLWLADELDFRFTRRCAVELDPPDIRKQIEAINPHGKVPIVQIGDVTIWESHTILRLFAAISGESSFWRANPLERASIEMWMDWSQTVLERDLMLGVFWGLVRTPEMQRDYKKIASSIERCRSHFSLLDRYLSDKEYMGGTDISLADIAVGTTLFRYFTLEIERPEVPNVERWYATLRTRDAFCKNVMVSFESLRGVVLDN
jgi:glutathione S-transferase